MQSKRSNQLLKLVLKSAQNSGQRVVLGVSPEYVPEDMNRKNIIFDGGVSHAWLFPRMAFILHHGGSGTCGSALSAGVPNTAIPFSVDQFFWAKRLALAGVGPSAPDARHLKEKDVTGLIKDGIENPHYLEKAINLAQKIRQEDGLSTALNIIQTIISL
jgi:UDP:flavonoid glycosyltransferase YjiC (YdhE family)